MKLLKCNICGDKFPEDTLIRTSKTRKLCQACHLNAEGFKMLIDNMCKLYGVDRPDGLWLSKIKSYKDSGIDYVQIWQIMDYITRILGKKPDEFTIMAVPNYYNSAKKFYETQWRFNNSLSRITQPMIINKIDIADVNIIKPILRNTRTYNIEEV